MRREEGNFQGLTTLNVMLQQFIPDIKLHGKSDDYSRLGLDKNLNKEKNSLLKHHLISGVLNHYVRLQLYEIFRSDLFASSHSC